MKKLFVLLLTFILLTPSTSKACELDKEIRLTSYSAIMWYDLIKEHDHLAYTGEITAVSQRLVTKNISQTILRSYILQMIETDEDGRIFPVRIGISLSRNITLKQCDASHLTEIFETVIGYHMKNKRMWLSNNAPLLTGTLESYPMLANEAGKKFDDTYAQAMDYLAGLSLEGATDRVSEWRISNVLLLNSEASMLWRSKK
jgi:hypothetical protein